MVPGRRQMERPGPAEPRQPGERQHERPGRTPLGTRDGKDGGHRYSATPLSLRIRHTLSGVIGMSMCLTPRWDRASTTALAMAGVAPTVADSPTPLAPKGWCGDGVTVFPVSHAGVSIAVGTR